MRQSNILSTSPHTSGPVYNDDGDIIISEEEFLQIQKLKDLKIMYRTDYDELKNLKTQVQYCQKLVDQCRQRLLNGKGGHCSSTFSSKAFHSSRYVLSCNWKTQQRKTFLEHNYSRLQKTA